MSHQKSDTQERPIYLDYNATTPIAPDVAEAMRPFLVGLFGNPSSEHPFGTEAKKALEEARAQVAVSIGAFPEEIVLTSGGTESNNLAIKGVAHQSRSSRRHIICSAVEHPAVGEVARQLQNEGFRVSTIPVDSNGRVSPDDLAATIDRETALVSVMLANNEVGTIQPIREIADIAHAHGAYMHTDAAQAIGKIRVRVDELGVELLSLAGHKFYAPKGVGALYVKSGITLEQQTQGAAHERGLRPGTENVMFAAALGRACERAGALVEEAMPGIERLRNRFEQTILKTLGEDRVRINAAAGKRLPNTSSISFRGVEATTLLAELRDKVAASAGAACHAEGVDISSVLMAMGIPTIWAMGTVRFSLGAGTTEHEIEQAAEFVCRAADRLGGGRQPPLSVGMDESIRLTRFTHGLGCACKIRPQLLERILAELPTRPDPNVIVDASTSDDAGVYKLSDEVALVQTADFFTPILDDAYSFGAVAAANALSDIYAMGARPIYALNLVGFPSQRLPESVLRDMLRGAAEKCDEAGISIIGGHTIEDPEPKFGLSVTGLVNPNRILRNVGAKVGDALVLTKPIGTGIVATGLKQGLVDAIEEAEVTAIMLELNKIAAEALEGLSVHACTDVTGFGLLGHLLEMTTGSGVNARVSAESIPVIGSARRLAAADIVPGGTRDNLRYVSARTRFEEPMTQSTKWILADAQTSGGLLISVSMSEVETLLHRLHKAGVVSACRVGTVTGSGDGSIHVVQ